MLSELTVATELLNTAASYLLLCGKVLLLLLCLDFKQCCNMQHLTPLRASDFPEACSICKAQLPLSFFGLFEEKLSKLKQSVILLIKMNK